MPNLLTRANTTAMITTFLSSFRFPSHAKGVRRCPGRGKPISLGLSPYPYPKQGFLSGFFVLFVFCFFLNRNSDLI